MGLIEGIQYLNFSIAKNCLFQSTSNTIPICFFLNSDRFKILKRRKKSTSRTADISLTTSLPAAAVHALQITTSSLSPELLATQSDKLRTADSEGEGSGRCISGTL